MLPTLDRCLSLPEVARVLGVDANHLRVLAREGSSEVPPMFRVGSRWKCRASSLTAWLEERESEAGAA